MKGFRKSQKVVRAGFYVDIAAAKIGKAIARDEK
jgi:hypothetical protein